MDDAGRGPLLRAQLPVVLNLGGAAVLRTEAAAQLGAVFAPAPAALRLAAALSVLDAGDAVAAHSCWMLEGNDRERKGSSEITGRSGLAPSLACGARLCRRHEARREGCCTCLAARGHMVYRAWGRDLFVVLRRFDQETRGAFSMIFTLTISQPVVGRTFCAPADSSVHIWWTSQFLLVSFQREKCRSNILKIFTHRSPCHRRPPSTRHYLSFASEREAKATKWF